jgi:L-ascorbate metabolism protein UlaG (beta-lactamase superfamily)
MHPIVTASCLLALAGLTSMARAADPGDPRLAPPSPEPACNTLALASTGGPTLHDGKTLLIRWMGFTNYELIYGDHIVLLDQWYDRAGTQYKDLGFGPADVKRADLMLVGHAHFDHMADTAQVGKQTHATIVAAPITADKLLGQGIDAAQIVRVAGTSDEMLDYKRLGFTVTPILARHGVSPKFTDAFGDAYKAGAPKPTPDEAAALAKIRERGASDPKIVTEGTIAYVFTFDDGFKVAWRNSGGVMTDYEKAALKKIGPVDVLLGAIAANIIAESQAKVLLPMLDTYRPDVWIPGHHEAEVGGKPDRATEPLFQYAKNAYPDLITVSKQIAEPTCFDTRQNRANGFRVRRIYEGKRPGNGTLNDWDVPGLY